MSSLVTPAIFAPSSRHASRLDDFSFVAIPQASWSNVALEVKFPFKVEHCKILEQTFVVEKRVDGPARDWSLLVLKCLYIFCGVPISTSHSEIFIAIFPGRAG